MHIRGGDWRRFPDAQARDSAVPALRAALAAFAGWDDRARARRHDVDKPGWVPWQPVMVLAMLLAVVCAALAVRV